MSITSHLTRSSSSSPSSSSPSSSSPSSSASQPSSSSSSTAVVRDPALPAPGTWTIDPGHAQVAFVGRHMVLTKVRGNLTLVDGAIVVDDDPASSSVEVTIDMASVQSGSEQRDEHLRSPDLFDVERFPTATYRSTAVSWTGSQGVVEGELTIKGITRPVSLDVELVGKGSDPTGTERAVFTATATVRREDFDVSWNMVLEGGGLLVSKEVQLEIDVEAFRR